jgi:hypothetical protein
MKAFYEHHKNSIEFHYRCFDRLLLNGLIQPFQQPERVLGLFNAYRDSTRVTRATLTGANVRAHVPLLYFPFSARVCLNQHHWLAIRVRQEGIDLQQCKNAFLKCSNPQRLQELADSLTARDLQQCVQKWLSAFTQALSRRSQTRRR